MIVLLHLAILLFVLIWLIMGFFPKNREIKGYWKVQFTIEILLSIVLFSCFGFNSQLEHFNIFPLKTGYYVFQWLTIISAIAFFIKKYFKPLSGITRHILSFFHGILIFMSLFATYKLSLILWAAFFPFIGFFVATPVFFLLITIADLFNRDYTNRKPNLSIVFAGSAFVLIFTFIISNLWTQPWEVLNYFLQSPYKL
ncbi:hypothetical protein K6119_17095 [Paracrocinitomix mangrovi]|uniref:hypothetical protein n=1 Tax=Paracrocinitomix mangrovi TaxID=2862509 RepID=UPI001C8CFDCE|nr:hypothetical protein [Paracrocinitomix mangrovi]UKN01444.1 hypothetical protein K6119_17095 [Paracrocinitomix mangrovi]